MPDMITVTPGAMTLAQMRIVERDGVALDLAGDWRTPVQTAAAMVDRVVEEERVVYGKFELVLSFFKS